MTEKISAVQRPILAQGTMSRRWVNVALIFSFLLGTILTSLRPEDDWKAIPRIVVGILGWVLAARWFAGPKFEWAADSDATTISWVRGLVFLMLTPASAIIPTMLLDGAWRPTIELVIALVALVLLGRWWNTAKAS